VRFSLRTTISPQRNCGSWIGLARYAARQYGCQVVGITISPEQFRYAQRWCCGSDVEIQLRDCREVTGQFDRAVSVGMVEHVGYKNYRAYMRVAARSLGEDGLFLCQGICGNLSRVHADPWIKRYIFPNSMLLSLAGLTRAAEGVLIFEDVKNIGPNYDPDTARLGGKLSPRLAPLCGSLRRTFPANVAILSAQLRGRLSGAQSADLFDSLFQGKSRHGK